MAETAKHPKEYNQYNKPWCNNIHKTQYKYTLHSKMLNNHTTSKQFGIQPTLKQTLLLKQKHH